MAVAVEIETLFKTFGTFCALKDVTLSVRPGELFFLLGPSGCGKTTLLRCIAGFHAPDSGTIRIGDRDVTNLPPHKRDTGMVFQSYALWPHMTLAENVAFGLEMRKVPRPEIRRRALEALERVHLADRAQARPNQLSGGQQQRVALARALVNEPAILLLDEPMSALDARLRAQVQVELRNLQRRLGKTFIMVTHDQDEALTVSDRIAVMNNATIVQCGTPVEIYERPKNRFVANFIGDANLFVAKRLGPCEIETEFGRFIMTMPIPWDQGEVIIRPENLRICEDPPPINGVRLKILDSIYLGDHQEIWFHQSGLKAKTHNRTLYPDNTELWVEFLKDGLVPLNEE